MKDTYKLRIGLTAALMIGWSVAAQETAGEWMWWLDIGGVIPRDATLTEPFGPGSNGKMELGAGFQTDLGLAYRFTDWLSLGPELGFSVNGVDSIGGWSYPNTMLSQVLMMANVRLDYPGEGRVRPFIGGGIGGSASFLTFYGSHHDDYDYYYDYDYADGTGGNVSLAFQAFGGINFRISDSAELGVVYRYLTTQPQKWDVDWEFGGDFTVGVESLRMHSICLILSATF